MKMTIDVPLTISLTTAGKTLDDMRAAYQLSDDLTEEEVHEVVKSLTAEGMVDEFADLLIDYGFLPSITVGDVSLVVEDDDEATAA